MEGLSTALRTVLKGIEGPDFDELLHKIDANTKAAEGVREITSRLDNVLCMGCGANKPRLRQMKRRLTAA